MYWPCFVIIWLLLRISSKIQSTVKQERVKIAGFVPLGWCHLAKPSLCSPQARKIGRCCSTSKLKSPDWPSLIMQPSLIERRGYCCWYPAALKYKRKFWALVSWIVDGMCNSLRHTSKLTHQIDAEYAPCLPPSVSMKFRQCSFTGGW